VCDDVKFNYMELADYKTYDIRTIEPMNMASGWFVANRECTYRNISGCVDQTFIK